VHIHRFATIDDGVLLLGFEGDIRGSELDANSARVGSLNKTGSELPMNRETAADDSMCQILKSGVEVRMFAEHCAIPTSCLRAFVASPMTGR
jgi:hypothetical protein